MSGAMETEGSPHARLARLYTDLRRLIETGAARTASMRFAAAAGWTEAELECFWRSRDVAVLQALAGVAEIALDQPGEADHIRALAVIERELEKLAATFDFREYTARGGKQQ